VRCGFFHHDLPCGFLRPYEPLWFRRTTDRRSDRFQQRLQQHPSPRAWRRRNRSETFDRLTRETAVFCGGVNPRPIRLRQVHDKAIVGGFERERISSPRPCGAD
jgi:hypothetical protein